MVLAMIALAEIATALNVGTRPVKGNITGSSPSVDTPVTTIANNIRPSEIASLYVPVTVNTADPTVL